MDGGMPIHFKKLRLLTIALVMVLVCGAMLPSLIHAQDTIVVRAYRTVNVRSGPSTAFPVIGQLTIDAVAEVTGRSDIENNWLQIDFEGDTGWVAYFTMSVEGNADLLPVVGAVPTIEGFTIISTPTASINPAVLLDQQVYVTSFRRVNLRSGPDTEYERINTLRAGETAQVVGRAEDNQWLQVEYEGQAGWVAYFVVSVTGELENVPVVIAPTRTPTPSATPTPTAIPPTETPVVILLTTRFNTNLRAEPSFTADVLGVVPYGTTLEVEARTDSAEWLQVFYEGETGWLVASLVDTPARRAINRLPVTIGASD